MTTDNPHSGVNGSPASAIAEALGIPFTNADIPLDRTLDILKDHRLDDGADSEEDAQLTESIRVHGVLQPIIVWEDARGFPIVAGRRRARCARRAGRTTISARILSRQPTDDEISLIALLENIQRKNISDVESGMAYLALMPTYGTASAVAKVVHKSVPTVARCIRLVERLPPDIRAQVGPNFPPSAAQILTGLHPDAERQRLFFRMWQDKTVTTADQLAAAIKANGKAEAPPVAGFSCIENGCKIAVTLPGQDLATAEIALQELLKHVRKHKTRGLEQFKEFLEKRAKAALAAEKLQAAKAALDAHVN